MDQPQTPPFPSESTARQDRTGQDRTQREKEKKKLTKHNNHLRLRQVLTDTPMLPVSEPEGVLLRPPAMHIEDVGVLEHGPVAVGRLVGRDDALVGADELAPDLDVVLCQAAHRHRRRRVVPAELFHEGGRPSVGVGFEFGELGGVLEEGYYALFGGGNLVVLLPDQTSRGETRGKG